MERAIAVDAQKQATDWLDSINSNFGAVKIRVSSAYETPPELTISEMPFFPEQQQAIAFVKKELAEKRSFAGMLPLGEYTIASKTFTVQKGQNVQTVNVSEEFSLAYIGPRLDIGAAAAS